MPPRVAIRENLVQVLDGYDGQGFLPIVGNHPENGFVLNPRQDGVLASFENRIKRELRLCSLLEETRGIIVKATKNNDGTLNLHRWVCAIPGPRYSPFEGGLYKFYVEFPATYPFKRPKFWFSPGFFHPNVDQNGRIHGTQLTNRRYNVMNKMWKILMEVENLLEFPDIEKIKNLDARRQFLRKRRDYRRNVQQQAQQYDPIRIRREIQSET
ncbi:unnamed protein product [Caenorhabditis brenneri]